MEDMRKVLQRDSGKARRERKARAQKKKNAAPVLSFEQANRLRNKELRKQFRKEGKEIPSWLKAEAPPLPTPGSKRQNAAYQESLAVSKRSASVAR